MDARPEPACRIEDAGGDVGLLVRAADALARTYTLS
jgi:hypothetical protein